MSKELGPSDHRADTRISKLNRAIYSIATIADRLVGHENYKIKKQAEEFEKRAVNYPKHDVAHIGRSLLISGLLYTKASRLYIGTEVLESAIAPLQAYKSTGNLDSHVCLAELYTSLERAHLRKGQKAFAEKYREALNLLNNEIDERFGPFDVFPTFDLNNELSREK